MTVKVLLENLVRHAGRGPFTVEDALMVARWAPGAAMPREFPFLPARVLLQDFTGVPAVVDLAAMRSAVARLGGDPRRINPLVPADLVIDHSVQVDAFGSAAAFATNVQREYERNAERYALLRWAQQAFRNFRVVPPGRGIVHQVNLEYLARVVWSEEQDGQVVAYPDTVVGTDSHTPMVTARRPTSRSTSWSCRWPPAWRRSPLRTCGSSSANAGCGNRPSGRCSGWGPCGPSR